MNPFDIFRRDLSVLRSTIGDYNADGLWIAGVPTSLVIRASVQPTPAEVMLTLPEGERTKESYTLYSDSELFTARSVGENQYSADIVIINNEEYTVIKVAPWQNNIVNHYEVIVIKGL